MSSELEKIYDKLDYDIDEEVEAIVTEIKNTIEPELLFAYNNEEEREAFFQELIKDDDNLLEELVDKLALVNVYSQIEDVKKADMEKVYLSMVDTLLELSKTVDPLSGFNKARLRSALDLIEDFENRYWPVSTKITAENAEVFGSLIPEQHYEDLVLGRKQALGALRHIGDDSFAAGVIIYSVLPADEEEPPEIRIEWVYVHEDLRQQGIGNFLMALVLDMATRYEGTVVSVELFTDTQSEILGAYLDSWQFEFELSLGRHFIVRLDDLLDTKYMEVNSFGAHSLKTLGNAGPILLEDFFKRVKDDPGMGDIKKLPYDYFDKEISCVCMEHNRIQAVFLLSSLPSGNIRYELLKTTPQADSSDMMKLMGYAYKTLMERGDKDKMFFGIFRSEAGFELAKKLLPGSRMPIVQTGYLIAKSPEITNEQWDEIRKEAGFSDDKIPED